MGNNYNLLLLKINEFTRKFYLNKLLRGSIYAAALILTLYLFLFTWIFYSYPSIATKTLLFYSYVAVSLIAVLFWIVKPALSYFHLSKTLSLEEAANLIGNHFFNVKDRLLNTLQLKELADSAPQNSALILAGIDQKINELKPIPFSTAINLGDNKKHIKYIALPLFIILLIGIIAPAILREGTSSFIRYNEEVLPKAPFDFVVENKSLNITQGDDLTIKVKLTGDEFPQDIYLEDGVNSYKLEKQDISHFTHTFKNIQKDKSIRFSGGGFNSASHTVNVKPRPSLLNLSASLIYPAYLNRKTEEAPNVGDLLIPEGTKVNWKLRTENSEQISFVLQQKVHQINVVNNSASFSAVIKQNSNYQIVPKNQFVSLRDSLSHQLTVIKDQFPSINVTETPDSLSSKALYFTGVVNDDYGFSFLKFRYQVKDKNKVVAQGGKSIAVKNHQTENNFFYLWNLNELTVKAGQTIDYFFEVADNDGVNGAKVTRSEIKTYQAPTQQQIAEKLAEGSQSLKQKMEQTIKLANSIEKDSKKLSESLLDKKQLNFEDKKQIEQLLDKQKQLDQAVKDIKDLNEKNNFDKEENGQKNALNEELKEKQKKIDELFNNVLDEKTKELLQKLQQLMDQNRKDQTREELSKMQMDNKSVKNELDRILELYKQLEFEQNLQNKIDRLNEMSKEQKDLSNQSKNNNSSPQDLKDKQELLNKDFKDLKKELQELDKKNQELERPNDYKNPEKETNEIEKNQQESKEQLSQNNKQKASEKQQQASEQMQQLAQKMQEQQQAGAEEENKVNAQELRKLLENLLSTSFEQEKVMLALRKMGSSDPAYVSQAQKQNMIRDNMKTIADSLFSLSKRVPQIESTVNTEVEKINFNIGKAIDFLGDRRTGEANRSQQFAMTSLNNLALMLNEALEQLQNAMKNAKGGKGKQKQGMQQLQQMQEQLNKNMQQAKEKMEREGNMGTAPKGQMSQEFAKMAQQQQMIREALEKINKDDNKDGKGALGNLNQTVQEMKQSELDLVNKRITQETINRQKNLMVKLLDAEKAQREQEQDEKRESNAAKQFPPSYQQMLEKFNKSMQSESELIQKLPPNLNYYYKNKVAEYFRLLNSTKQ